MHQKGNFVFVGAGDAYFIGCSFLDAGGIVWWAGNGEFLAVSSE